MYGPSDRIQRRKAHRLMVRHSFLLLLLLAVLVAGIRTVVGIRPLYAVSLNGHRVGIGRNLADLERALWDEWERERQRKVTLTAREQEWEFRLAELGFGSPAEPLREALFRAMEEQPWQQRFPWSTPTLTLQVEPLWDMEQLEAALSPIKLAITRPTAPARLVIQDKTPVIIPEERGTMIDTYALATLLQQSSSARIAIPVAEQVPEVTADSLRAMGIRQMLAEWSTQYDPSIPRADNVARAARAFNGVTLRPDEIISYNATVGPITTEAGWKEASVFVNGEIVTGVGGGACQVASTFYGAALRANLDIVERHPHQLVVSYIEPSQDAAIAQGFEDLKVRNNTGSYLYIETETTQSGTVAFRIYGDAPAGQVVRIESTVLSRRPYPTREVVDHNLRPGERVLKIRGNQGLTSEAYRLVYQHETLMKRERLSQDTYQPTTEVVLVGTK